MGRSYLFFFFGLFFWGGQQPWHMEVPRLEANLQPREMMCRVPAVAQYVNDLACLC